MNFLELLDARYSVRNFADKSIEEDKLQTILEAGRRAPTAINEQPQRIFVLQSSEALAKIRGVTRMAYNAPVVLLICYDKNVSWKAYKFGDDYDAGEMSACIITTAMMMQATELGIGSLWVRGYCTQDLIGAFELPANIVPVCLLDLGYPAENSKPSSAHFSRLPISDTVKEL